MLPASRTEGFSREEPCQPLTAVPSGGTTDRGSQFRSRKFVHTINWHDIVGSWAAWALPARKWRGDHCPGRSPTSVFQAPTAAPVQWTKGSERLPIRATQAIEAIAIETVVVMWGAANVFQDVTFGARLATSLSERPSTRR